MRHLRLQAHEVPHAHLSGEYLPRRLPRKDLAEVQSILDSMKGDWMGPTYDLLRKNCCSFSDAFAQALGVGPDPEVGPSLGRRRRDS